MRIRLLPALLLLTALPVVAAGAAPGERSLDKEVLVNASLDQAWAAWTTREGITSFLAPEAEIEPKVGGAFHIHFDPFAAPGLKGADTMRFMALQPKQMLSFDWNAPPSLPVAREQRTFVVVRFAQVSDTQTRVSLHHTGWGDGGEWDQTFAYFDNAWGRVLANLQKRFDTGPQDWRGWLAGLRKSHDDESAAKPDAGKR